MLNIKGGYGHAEKKKNRGLHSRMSAVHETVKLVKELSCPSCEVTIYNLQKEGMEKAKEYGINSVPTVVVDGKIAECCARKKPSAADLKKAGIGTPL
jgi:glutaredoxin 3